jgi:hypothetical protein
MYTAKRGVVLADLHCGHQVGLTPPDWQYRYLTNDTAKHNKYAEVQRQCWSFFSNRIKQLGHIDIAIINADCIDGRGEKSGGTELIEIDRQKQCEMATECIDFVKAKKKVMTYGTPYHVGQIEDWENTIAKDIKAESIGAHEWYDINGKMFDVKHQLGSSGVPHGRGAALFKEWLWNALWNEAGDQPKADVIIRSHVHYFQKVEGVNWEAISTPALQAMGSKFGSRRCSGIVHFGFLSFEIDRNGRITWEKHIAKIEAQKAKALKL